MILHSLRGLQIKYQTQIIKHEQRTKQDCDVAEIGIILKVQS